MPPIDFAPAPRLTTPRLLLRGWRASDLAPFAAMNADPQVMEFMPKLLARDESDAMVGRIQGSFRQRGFGLWAVEVAATGAFAGYVGLTVPRFAARFTPCVEIGWGLAAGHWGQGIATEAARVVLRFGYCSLDLDEIVSFTAPANFRSRAVMARLGLRHAAADDFDHPLLPEGHRLRRHVLYRLKRSEWRA